MLPRENERYQGVEKHSSGFKLLASMGWKEGEGLGAKRQGLKHHIKVRKMQENAGIGLAEAARKAKDWTVGMAAYDQVLAKLKNVGSPPASVAASPEVGKTKKRKQTSATALPLTSGTKKVKSSKEECVDASIGTADKAEKTAVLGDNSSHAKELAKAETAIAARASHLARFGRRRAGKNVRSYSGSDLAAILGENSVAASSASEAKSSDEIAKRLVVDLRETIQLSTLQDCQEEQQAQPDDEQRWWYSIFARSGRLGSSAPQPAPASSSKPKVKVTGFSEDDQTNLYMMAHDASGKGRQGLGIASRPKKVAGARWQGTKKRIEDSEDEQAPASEEQVQPGEQPDSEDCSEDTHISSQEQPQHHAEPEAFEQHTESMKRVQPAVEQVISTKALVKAVRRVLGAAPGGQLRQKKLEKRVLDVLEVQRGSSERKQMRRALLAAIASSGKLKLSEGMVTC